MIKNKDNVKGLRAIDVAPTLAFLMDIPGPQNARGRILYDIIEDADDLSEITILDISDYHGQLIPLTEAADNLLRRASTRPSPSAAPRSSRSGSTPTRPRRRFEATTQAGVIEMAAGDSVGATPPISASSVTGRRSRS